MDSVENWCHAQDLSRKPLQELPHNPRRNSHVHGTKCRLNLILERRIWSKLPGNPLAGLRGAPPRRPIDLQKGWPGAHVVWSSTPDRPERFGQVSSASDQVLAGVAHDWMGPIKCGMPLTFSWADPPSLGSIMAASLERPRSGRKNQDSRK